MKSQAAEFKTPENYFTGDDKHSAPHKCASEYTVESMKKHHDETVYYKQRKGGEWMHGRINQAYKENYDCIKWN